MEKQTKPGTENLVRKTVDQVSAQLNGLRIAPRKVRLLCKMLSGLKPSEALLQLKFSSKRSAKPLAKLINSALANAKISQLEVDKLIIAKFVADEGQVLHRHKPAAFGVAHGIKKRSSKVKLVLALPKK
jgi:large subunit ribosomal protein L22